MKALAKRLLLDTAGPLIPEIIAYYSEKKRLNAVLESLSNETCDYLELLFRLSAAPACASLEKLQDFKPVQELSRAGLLWTARESFGGERLVIPEELERGIRDFLINRRAAFLRQAATVTGEGKTVRAPADAFLRNVETVLALAGSEPLPLTAKGNVAKPFARRRILPFLENPIGLEETILLQTIVDYAAFFRLLRKKEKVLLATEHKEEFLAASPNALGESLLLFLEMKRPDPETIFLLEVLRLATEDGSWLRFDRFREVLNETRKPFAGLMEPRTVFEERIRDFHIIGYCEQLLEENGVPAAIRVGHYWRKGGSGRCETSFFVTPDFFITAPRTLDPTIRSVIFRIGDLVAADMMDRWRLTRESLQRAWDGGARFQQIREFLERYSRTPVPVNVLESIRLWLEEYGKLALFDGMALIVENERDQVWVEEFFEREGGLVARPAPNLFLFSRGGVDRLLPAIEKRRRVAVLRERGPERAGKDFEEIVKKTAAEFRENHLRDPFLRWI